MSDTIRHIVVGGRVQGVGYRAWVAHQAGLRRLEGWVRNRRDGSVEAVFAGPEAVVSDMIAACRRGPSAARVGAIQDQTGSSDLLNLRDEGEGFSILPTV